MVYIPRAEDKECLALMTPKLKAHIKSFLNDSHSVRISKIDITEIEKMDRLSLYDIIIFEEKIT